MKENQKQSRVCGSKVTTGCITCKKRRIKCDEGKPTCRRCTSTGRHCDGYAIKQKMPSRLYMVLYRAPGSSSLVSEQEKQSFQFFSVQTKHRFPVDFSHPVLQVSHTEEVLTCALTSFGALQQLYEHGDDSRLESPLGQFAMRQYGRALRLLQAHSKARTPDVTLICCLLFACFECIRGCRRAAIIHIKSGWNILQHIETESTWNIVSQRTMKFLFTRLDNQVVELLGTSLPRTLKQDSLQTSSVMAQLEPGLITNDIYHSLDGALNHILYERLDIALDMGSHMVPGLRIDQGRTSRYLEEWHRGFMCSLASPQLDVQSEISDTYGQDPDIMRMWYILGSMYLAVRPDQHSEEVWDQFLVEFGTIVSLAEKYLLRARRQRPRKRTFSFSLGIIPPLYVTGVRCRDMNIRRRAIWLLEDCERREILWDSKLAAGAIRRVMELEESSTIPSDGSSEQKLVRVSNVTATLDDENGVSLEFE